jgi:hypothetical protein
MALQHDDRRGDATSSSQLSMVPPPPPPLPPPGAAGASLMEVSAFMAEQLKAQLLQQREYDKAQHGEMMRLIQEQKEEMKQLRDEAAEAKLEATQAESDATAKTALQMRIEMVHAARLLSDDERDAVEDAIADSADGDCDSAVQQMIALSEKFLVDRAFARQLRRKHAS